MTLDQICVTKEWAEKLKGAGYPQRDSVFYWAIGGDKCENEWRLLYSDDEGWSSTDIIAAPTASEILEKLPQIIEIEKTKFQLFISMVMDRQYFVVYVDEKDYHNNATFAIMACHELTQALAKMYCYLVSKNIITLKDSL